MAKKTAKTRKLKAPATKRSDLDFAIVDVVLAQSSCNRAGLRAGLILPNEISLTVRYTVKRSSTDPNQLLVIVPIDTKAAYATGEPPALSISATFVAALRFPKTLPEDVSQLARKREYRDLGLYHVWPYWRQFIQMTAVAMGLPPMQLPVQIPAEILNDLTEAVG